MTPLSPAPPTSAGRRRLGATSPVLAATAAVGVVVLAVLGASCSREPAFADRTARLTLDGEVTTFTLDGCLLDGTTFVMAGRSDDGQVLQATVGVEADGTTGVPASTGFTVIDETGAETGAFGSESWARREGEGPPPGSVASAAIRGARVRAAGRAQPIDVAGETVDSPSVSFSLDSRCDDPDE